jgi:hypothetical protein
MSKNKPSRQRALRAAGATLALLGAAALPLSATAQTAAPQTAAQGADALTVVRDADTGQLRAPTADEAAALSQKAGANARRLRSAPPPPLQKFHSSGAQGVRLTDEMASAAVMVRTPDGKLAAQCVDSHEAAEGIHKAGHIHTTPAPTE